MKRVCCSSLFRALVEGRLEWTPVSKGDAAGPLVVGRWIRGFVPLHWCPYCGEEV